MENEKKEDEIEYKKCEMCSQDITGIMVTQTTVHDGRVLTYTHRHWCEPCAFTDEAQKHLKWLRNKDGTLMYNSLK